MRRLAAFLAAGGALLGLAAAASAKELKEIKICGPAACASVTDRATLEALGPPQGAYTASKPGAPSEYYTVTYTIEHGPGRTDAWTLYYLPAVGLLRGKNERGLADWTELDATTRGAFRKVTTGVAPFPKPTLTGVRVGGRPITAEPSSYLSLYEVGSRFLGSTRKAKWQTIKLESQTPTPWTDEATRLSYSRNLRLIRRDGQIVRISKALCDRITRGLALN